MADRIPARSDCATSPDAGRSPAAEATASRPAPEAADVAAALREEVAAVQAQAQLQIARAARNVQHGRTPTARQREVLALIAVGHTVKEVSRRLGLSLSTAATHRKNGMRRIGVESRAELMSWALHNGHVLAEGEKWTAQRFLGTVRQAPLMVLVADAEMRFRDASDAALRELGYTHGELLKLSVPDVVLDRKDAGDRYASYLGTGAQHGTITLRRRDQSPFEASYSATVRHVAGVPHYVSILIPA